MANREQKSNREKKKPKSGKDDKKKPETPAFVPPPLSKPRGKKP